MAPKIEAVFFDLGDTLVHISFPTVMKICNKIGEIRERPLSTKTYRTAFANEWSNRSSLSDTESVKGTNANSEESERQYWKNFFESLLPALEVKSYQSKLVEYLVDIYVDPRSFTCFEDVYNVLSKLKHKGLTLGIISNAFPSADKILDHLELRKYFKYIFLSFELPYAKPESRMYQFAAEKANIPIENILFVDDRWSFVKGAQEANMNAWLIERFPDEQPRLSTSSLVNRVKSLDELLEKTGLSQIAASDIVPKIEKTSAFLLKDVCAIGNPYETNSNSFSDLQNSWREEIGYVGRQTSLLTNFSGFAKRC
jgi:HAD superfamily hydrolase (TIGR01509 family)